MRINLKPWLKAELESGFLTRIIVMYTGIADK